MGLFRPSLDSSGRQASVFDPETEEFTLIDTCFGTHHLQFGEDSENTLYFSGDSRVVGWVRTNHLLDGDQGPLANPVRDQALARIAARARAAQGWCPTIIDTNGDGRITRPWNSGSGLRDPNLDTPWHLEGGPGTTSKIRIGSRSRAQTRFDGRLRHRPRPEP